ncbi:hypothetical protein OJAV_G00085700 [Oryzias javanicus]|uniref:Uncharacterized protein n=1 Tax=Oryzias javanicus TaxID=123683 RepID=A0A437CZ06_ORYJA|nr:hypothetical protein OJAV_G00085700 [Oryzias javanicus]
MSGFCRRSEALVVRFVELKLELFPLVVSGVHLDPGSVVLIHVRTEGSVCSISGTADGHHVSLNLQTPRLVCL